MTLNILVCKWRWVCTSQVMECQMCVTILLLKSMPNYKYSLYFENAVSSVPLKQVVQGENRAGCLDSLIFCCCDTRLPKGNFKESIRKDNISSTLNMKHRG